ncbi:MAG: metal ABC transporter ATP-binding protein [Acidimicrobiia bacterium]
MTDSAASAPDRRPVLVARSMSVGYHGRAVLTGVDAFLVPGASVALVGSNGSGKSTLLRTIAGLIPPVAGALEVLGGEPGSAPRAVAYLNQFHASGFVLPLRAIDVVRMARFDHRGRFRRETAEDHALVDDAMRRMQISHLAAHPLRSLSGGQQQRVYLAQVLARRARLLLLDEPTAGLDAAGREAYLEAMRVERERGAALVTSTHDIGEAVGCDRVMLLARRVIAEGPPARVLTPEHLLETFGISFTRIGDRLIVSEAHHLHDDPTAPGLPPHQH